MTRFDDDEGMRWTRDEQVLAGELGQDEPELTALVAAVRSMADAPPPPPSAALQQMLQDGIPDTLPAADLVTDELAERRRLRGNGRRVGLGVRIAVGAVAAAIIATGAAALEPVPEAVRGPARAIISGVADLLTPWSSNDPPGREQSGATSGAEQGTNQGGEPGSETGNGLQPGSTPEPDDVGNQNRGTPEPESPAEELGRPADVGQPADPAPPAPDGTVTDTGAGDPSAPPDATAGEPDPGRPYPYRAIGR